MNATPDPIIHRWTQLARCSEWIESSSILAPALFWASQAVNPGVGPADVGRSLGP